MRARAFNPQVFLELLCHCVFAGLMLHLVISRKYLSYVTPRMEPYLWFTAIMMGIWALTGLGRLFRPQQKIRSAHCLVLVIPILLILLPHSPLSTSSLSGNYIGGNMFSGPSGKGSYTAPQSTLSPDNSIFGTPTDSPIEKAAGSGAEPTDDPLAIAQSDQMLEDKDLTDSIGSAISGTPTDLPGEEYSTDLHGLDVQNKKITVANDDFGMWISEIYMYPEEYEGYTISMTGFVFKDPEIFEEDEFVPARLMMSCCAADLVPAGLLCKYDKVSQLQAESWVTVEGTLFISQYEYDGMTYEDPEISVTKITEAEEVEGYVYP